MQGGRELFLGQGRRGALVGEARQGLGVAVLRPPTPRPSPPLDALSVAYCARKNAWAGPGRGDLGMFRAPS